MPAQTPHRKPLDLQTDTSWYTLDPIHTEGEDALDPHGIPGIRKATLIEIEIDWRNAAHAVTIRKADDLFKSTGSIPAPNESISVKAAIVRATFNLQLDDSERPH